MTNNIVFIQSSELKQFMIDVLSASGVPPLDADVVSDVLIEADIRGIDSHGINRLKPIYFDRIKAGILNPVTDIKILKQSPTTAMIDGNNGMGHVIGKKSMQIAIDKAKQFGMGMVAVRNSSHYGIAGYYALMASDSDMIGITGTNARPSIAPTFGVENMLGTNPITFALPTDEDFPFFLDCATSVSQRGKIELYARENKPIPEGWVIDSNGNSKTNAKIVLDDLINDKAALAPLGGIGEEHGGYKGYGYATVVEILCAALQSGNYLKMLTGFRDGKKIPYGIGHFFIAIDISAFTEISEFKKIAGEILRELRASKKMPGFDRIFTAGEKEYIISKERIKNGIPINQELLMEMKQLAVELRLFQYEKFFK